MSSTNYHAGQAASARTERHPCEDREFLGKVGGHPYSVIPISFILRVGNHAFEIQDTMQGLQPSTRHSSSLHTRSAAITAPEAG